MRLTLPTCVLLGVCLQVTLHATAVESGRELTLTEALTMALSGNPDVAEAESRLAESDARLRIARAGGGPTLRARGSYDYWTDDQRLNPATRNADPGVFGPTLLGAELVASLPLYTGGRVSGETDAADWSRVAAGEQVMRTRESLVYQVTAVFYDLLAQEEVLRSLQAAVKSMDEQQRTTKALVDAEKAARVDLLRANVLRAELHALEVRTQNNRTVQQRAWAALLGLDDDAAPVARGSLAAVRPPTCADAETCMRQAYAGRADRRAAQAAVSTAMAAVRAARAGYRPTLAAQAAYGARWMPGATDHPEQTDDHKTVGRVGLVAEIPLFDSDLTRARIDEQTARLRGARERLRKLELQIRFEVETALADIAAAQERVRTAEQAVGQAGESFRIIKEKYDLGKGTMTDVLDAQAALVTVQTSFAGALADLAVADARRKLAVGEIVP